MSLDVLDFKLHLRKGKAWTNGNNSWTSIQQRVMFCPKS